MRHGSKIEVMFICFVLMTLMCGCKYFENNNTQDCSYLVQGIRRDTEEVSADYFFSTKTIYQFSISEQEIVGTYGEDEWIANYAVCDKYIFYLTDTGKVDTSEKIWKYDRLTGTSELFLETQYCYCMTVYDGYLFYGSEDIYICPIDGDPEKDNVSLMKQFSEDAPINQEILYKGWRVKRDIRKDSSRRPCIMYVMDGNEVIIENEFHRGSIWAEGQWILFSKDADTSRFYYQKEDESEKYQVECLSDNAFRYSEIWDKNIVYEDGKIIGLLTISNNARTGFDLIQKDVENDLLFEIDLETNTSKILYSTENNQTRIVGYQDGMVYLFENGAVYKEQLTGNDREMLLDLKAKGWNIFDSAEIYFNWWGNHLVIWTSEWTQEGEDLKRSLKIMSILV